MNNRSNDYDNELLSKSAFSFLLQSLLQHFLSSLFRFYSLIPLLFRFSFTALISVIPICSKQLFLTGPAQQQMADKDSSANAMCIP